MHSIFCILTNHKTKYVNIVIHITDSCLGTIYAKGLTNSVKFVIGASVEQSLLSLFTNYWLLFGYDLQSETISGRQGVAGICMAFEELDNLGN